MEAGQVECRKGASVQTDIFNKGAFFKHQRHRYDRTVKIQLFSYPCVHDPQPLGRGVRSPVHSNSARISPARMVLS